jgi:tetratricopeptide (TPR) repeat protein
VRRLAAATLAVALAVAPCAAAADARETFYRGTAFEREGKYDEAAKVYLEIVERSPEDPFADDALAELAKVYEEKLGRPADALAAYERLLADYPQSRLAARARSRAEFLRGAMGTGGKDAAAVAELNDILFNAPRLGRDEVYRRLRALHEAHPDFAEAPRVAYRLGVMAQEVADYDEAERWFESIAARAPRGDWGARAVKALGDLAMLRREWDEAATWYRRLPALGAQYELNAREALDRLAIERARAGRAKLSWIALALFPIAMLVWLWRDTRGLRAMGRALVKPPAEALFFIPVAVLFAAAAMTEHAALGHAIELIVGGGLVVTWLSGAVLEAARRAGKATRLRIVAHVLTVALSVAALCYVAVTRERLLDMLAETIEFGAQR